MKTQFRSKLLSVLLVLVMVLALVPVSAFTAFAAGSVRVDFCLTNGALENNVFFENDSSKYFMSQQTKVDGTLTSLEELYRTDNLDLEFDGWYTDKGEKVTLETVFTEYTIVYDRWKETTLTDEDIISDLEIGTPLLEVGEAAGTYGANSITLTDSRLSVEGVSVYEGLNAYRTNKLEDSDVLEAGKSYSLRVELHTKNGELIDDQLMNHSTATYGLVANMVYSHDYSGIFTTQWTNRENKIQVIINYDFENYYFTSDLEDKVVENGQSPQYTVYVSNNANIQGMELFVKNANDTWASLGAVTGQFNIPANSNVVKQYRVEVTYQNGFVISSNTFSVDWYDPNAPKFITQPTDYDVAYGTNVQVSWGLNFDSSSIVVERKDGETWVEYQSAYNDGAQISSMPESGTYTFRAHATKNGADYYSEEFTITWREKFVFTTQPQSQSVGAGLGEDIIITWDMDIGDISLLQIFKIEIYDTSEGWKHYGVLTSDTKSHTFSASDFAYSQKYRLMANYDGVIYYSDEFTIEFIAGEFTSKPDSTINAVVGNDCLVEWDFSFDVKYYNIKVYDGNDWVLFATTDKPEYNFTASEVGEKQYLVYAYNANDQRIGEAYLTFTINWKEQQIVYLISFNANDGTGTMQPVEKNAGAEYTLPSCDFTAPNGKKFKAWSVNDVEKQVGDTITINANTVVKAVWEDNVYQVIYQPGEASGNNEPYEYEANETIEFLDCEDVGYTRDGFEFDYWSIRIFGDNFTEVEQKRANETYTLTTDIIAVAMWKEVTAVPTGITATYSGTILAGNKINPSSISIMLNYSNSSNEPVNAGNVEYWYNGSQIQDPINYVFGVELIGNLNITVKYQGFETTMAVQVVGYEITFNANTGSGTMESVEYVGAYTLPVCTFTAPDGKQFKGWATSANGEVINETTYNVTEPVTLYAIWENIPAVPTGLTASYNGTILAGNKLAINQLTVKLQYSDSSEMPCAGLCEYWYNGSKINDPINYVFGVELIGTRTITVKYLGLETTFDVKVVGYKISFNANDGSGTMTDVEYVGEYTLPSCGFTAPTGKLFKGWATSANGSVIEGTTYNVTANVEFFAIWENIPVTNYTINATAGANGTISPSGEVTVAEGEDKTFTITANSGYHIKDVKVNGSSVGAVSTYTFNDVAANATITVEFEVDTVPHVCNPTLVPEDEPDCTTAGKSAYYHCECGKNYEDAQGNTEITNLETWGILNALGHNPSTAWSTDGEYHWKECTRCAGQQLEKAAHSGGTATCTEKAVCATCNTAYGNTVAHSHGSEWKTDANEHWNECACGDKANKAAHTDSNNDGKCDTCEYQMSTTPDNPNNTPDNPNNTPDDPNEDKDGLGAGAIVGIVIGSVAVVGIGGFALFWFVIKKKSFADLIAVFKKK